MTGPAPGAGREPGDTGRPAGQLSDLARFSGRFNRAWLYVLALVLIGLFVAPMVWSHPRIGRGEKALILFLALLHDLASVAIVVVFGIWMYQVMQRAMIG